MLICYTCMKAPLISHAALCLHLVFPSYFSSKVLYLLIRLFLIVLLLFIFVHILNFVILFLLLILSIHLGLLLILKFLVIAIDRYSETPSSPYIAITSKWIYQFNVTNIRISYISTHYRIIDTYRVKNSAFTIIITH